MSSDSMTPQDAIDLFDSLEPAQVADMMGRWRGEEIATGHPMEGMLTASYWHGKRFDGPDEVHPLVHHVPFWGERMLNPALMPLRLLMSMPLRDVLLPWAVPVVCPFVSTGRHKARLRTLEFRGRMHAVMCYDARPINDIFCKIDRTSVMGWMDFKGMDRPYFFKLVKDG